MNVLITLTTAGIDTGPFNLYSNTDSYVTAFQTNIAKSLLVAGYTSTVVPAGTTYVRVKSTGLCTNYIDIYVTGSGTTTTTTTAPVGPTTTTTTTPYVGPSTTTTTTTSGAGTTTTTTTSGGPTTTTTTTTASSPTTTTTTTNIFVSCEEWRNDTLEEATITYTPCGSGTPVSNYALATTSSVCAVFGSITVTVGGPLTLVGSCSAPSTTTTTTAIPGTTTTTTTALVYYAFSLTAGGIDSPTACADSFGALTLYGSNISFLSNATFYNDYTLLSPYDGSNLYYKNVANNEYVQISSIGSQTAAGSC